MQLVTTTSVFVGGRGGEGESLKCPRGKLFVCPWRGGLSIVDLQLIIKLIWLFLLFKLVLLRKLDSIKTWLGSKIAGPFLAA